MKTIDFSYFIERYIAAEMNQNEILWFEKELAGNESLQKEVLLRKKTDKILERQDILSLRNKLASIERSRLAEAQKPAKANTPRFRHAAMLTGLIVIGSILFFSYRPISTDNIYQKYYEAYKFPNTSRSSETTLNSAIENLNKGEFGKAQEELKSYLKTSKIEFLTGVTNMGIMNYPEAQNSFNNVINREVNLYTDEANWYLALCYIVTKDKPLARIQLSKIAKSKSLYNNEAKSILRHL